jgi:3'-phosphoadenosine 5'-phosphosulfate sulfotransferase (PAPS reductase)/FAD synthetase
MRAIRAAAEPEVLFDLGEMLTPDLRQFHVCLLNSSGGKDSQAMLTDVVEAADAQGVPRDRLLVVHADMGRVEWPGTRELAERQAAAYGLRFVTVARGQDLLDQVVTRRETLDAEAAELEVKAQELAAAGLHELAERAAEDAAKKLATPAWPSSTARYCTSDHKTSQVAKLMTRLAAEYREANPGAGPIRILNCLGIRRDESPARAKKQPLGPDPATNSRRKVTRWLPIFFRSESWVWATIERSGLPYHPAYDASVPRLSCVFCVLAGQRELVIAARLNPDLGQAYLEVERRVGHTIKADLSMKQIIAAAQAGPAAPVSLPVIGGRR